MRTQIRLPVALAEKLKQLAKDNDKSFNSEMVDRLEASVENEFSVEEGRLTAVDAVKIRESARIKAKERLLAECFREIERAAKRGYSSADVATDDSLSLSLWKMTAEDTIKTLTDLGFSVQIVKAPVTRDFMDDFEVCNHAPDEYDYGHYDYLLRVEFTDEIQD